MTEFSYIEDDEPDEQDTVVVDSPIERGWATWTSGRCSITRCLEPPIAAIERTMRRGRAPYWQPYCEEHARMRGVERANGELIWTAAFLEPSDRRTRRPLS